MSEKTTLNIGISTMHIFLRFNFLFIFMAMVLTISCGTVPKSYNDSQSDSIVAIVANWKKGDSRKYKITKLKKKYKPGALVENRALSYYVVFNVTDESPESYTIDWSVSNMAVGNDETPDLGSLRAKNNIAFSYKYLTSETGQFDRILNIDEVQGRLMDMFNSLPLDDLVDESSDYSKSFEVFFTDLLNEKENIEQWMITDIQEFHSYIGYEIDTKEVMEFEVMQHLPFEGGPIKARGEVIVFNDVDNMICRIRENIIPDPTELNKAVKTAVTEIVNKASYKNDREKLKKFQWIDSAFDKSDMTIEDTNYYEYQYNLGWPIKIHTTRVVVIDEAGEETITVREMRIDAVN